jgi:hypothetical protein
MLNSMQERDLVHAFPHLLWDDVPGEPAEQRLLRRAWSHATRDERLAICAQFGREPFVALWEDHRIARSLGFGRWALLGRWCGRTWPDIHAAWSALTRQTTSSLA